MSTIDSSLLEASENILVTDLLKINKLMPTIDDLMSNKPVPKVPQPSPPNSPNPKNKNARQANKQTRAKYLISPMTYEQRVKHLKIQGYIIYSIMSCSSGGACIPLRACNRIHVDIYASMFAM